MPLENETENVTLTPEAAQVVQDLLVKRNLPGYALRVYVAGQSCQGIVFGLALDKEARPGDVTFESEGVSVLVDDQSIEYLRGATIELINDPQRGQGFFVNSPVNAPGGSCDCGSGCASCGA